MSNHCGSRMLNDVLQMLEKKSVFETLGKAETQKLVREVVVRASNKYDCNSGEILEDIGERVGVCYYCLKNADEFRDGLCEDCNGELNEA